MKYIVYMKFSSIVLILLLVGSQAAQTNESQSPQIDEGDKEETSRTQSSECVTNKPIDADFLRLPGEETRKATSGEKVYT
jgi:hypothetical protein